MPENPLTLSFSPSTIDALGIKMYSRLPYALAEIVANAYDANASNIHIKLYDADSDNKYIIVSDDGIGMSYDEVNEKFLIIGRHRRDTGEEREIEGRKITGRKGLGKLALFGIGKIIDIETTSSGEATITKFCLDWDAIVGTSNGQYHPRTEFLQKSNINSSGTKIKLTKLTRETNFNLLDTAIALSKMFNILGENFQVFISKNDTDEILLTKELKYENIEPQKEWDFTTDILPNVDDTYEFKDLLTGKIIATPKPMRADLRGITLYANGRLVNTPGFFGVSEAGHTFTYLTGYIEADFLDEFEEDLVSTDRQSLSWDLPEAQKLQLYLQKVMKFLVQDWSAMRKEKKEESATERTGVNIHDWLEKVPQELKGKIQEIINQTGDKPEISDEDYSKTVKNLHALFPEYTYFHYRWLHDQIRDAAKQHYMDKNFYMAFQEAMKRYKNAVKAKSCVTVTDDLDIVSNSFGSGKPLETTANFKLRPDGQPFSMSTLENIENGQMQMSRGIVQGGRNVVSHEEHIDLQATGLFTEKDCLDLLSLLSHLFRRLDESVKRP